MKKIIAAAILIILSVLYVTNNHKVYLTEKYYKKGNYIEVNSEKIESLKKETYILYTYNSYCNLKIPCETIFKKTMEKYKIDFLSTPFAEFKKTSFYKKVNYAPSVLIVSKGKIISYLDANKDSDLEKYQDEKAFEKWLQKYIKLSKFY